MAAVEQIVAQLVSHRPFAVLGYSAEDGVWCPRCLRSAAGLSPSQVDTSGRPVTPLYARDRAVREEVCDNCERSLLDLLAASGGSTPPRAVTAHLRVHAKRSALDFDRVPPIEIRTVLKATGWRWDPRFRVWWSTQASPRVPAAVVIPADAPAAQARQPTVHRRSSKTP